MHDAAGGSFHKKKLGYLGNEFDNYAEIGFSKEINADNSKSVYLQTMINMYDGGTNSNNNEANFGWENINLLLQDFMGLGETT
ncbi:carbohydrate porin [Aeromonas hydrophila]|nr:carbohydrate porin [Aeromonas hydrophila]